MVPRCFRDLFLASAVALVASVTVACWAMVLSRADIREGGIERLLPAYCPEM